MEIAIVLVAMLFNRKVVESTTHPTLQPYFTAPSRPGPGNRLLYCTWLRGTVAVLGGRLYRLQWCARPVYPMWLAGLEEEGGHVTVAWTRDPGCLNGVA